MPPSDPELKEYDYQFAQIEDEVRALVGAMTDAQLNWRPAPERWSIGECLVHLTVVGNVYAPSLDAAIASARAAGITAQGPFRYRWLDRLFVTLAEPPPKIRFKAPRTFVPTPPSHTVSDVRDGFLATNAAIRLRLERANGLDLKTPRVPSPASARITISLGAAFALLAAHERRHVWQAQRVRGAAGFPR